MGRRIALLALVAALAIGPAWAQMNMFSSFNHPTGLIGWWKLCGDTSASSGCAASSSTAAFDSSGYGQTATWNGTESGTTAWYSSGHVGPYAGTFDGSPNLVSAVNLASLNGLSQATISLWVKPPSIQTLRNLAGSISSTAAIWGIETGTAGSDLIPYFASNFHGDTASGQLSTSSWTFVAMVFNGTLSGNAARLKVYVNGAAQTLSFSGTVPTTTPTTTNNFTVGAYADSTRFFPGLIDDVRIFNRALAASEIAQMALAHN